jgi:hypothetical protein
MQSLGKRQLIFTLKYNFFSESFFYKVIVMALTTFQIMFILYYPAHCTVESSILQLETEIEFSTVQ